MSAFSRKLLLLALLAAAIVIVAFIAFFLIVQPPWPGRFYATPKDVPSEPGVLLRTEAVDTDVQRANGYRILYSSRDMHDELIAVSGMVLVPKESASDAGFSVVAWAHGTSGVVRQCAPSLMPQSTTQNIMGAQDLVDAGYIVVATDYQGLGTEGPHAYLVGRSEASAVLDSVKALQGHATWQAAPRFVLWGHSQGGHAALFASQFAPAYASDLELVGTAVAAPATELTALLRHDLAEPAGKVFGSMALKSWSQLFPDAELSRIVKERDLPLVEAVAEDCIETSEQGLAELPEITLMSKDFVTEDIATTEPWASIIEQNSVEANNMAGPLFIAQGSADMVVEPEVSKNWATQVCSQNPSVIYREYSGKNHLDVGVTAVPDVLAWMGDRFAGEAPETGCHDL